MNRMKLGLFGGHRPSAVGTVANTGDRHPAMVERQERLAGLTPVERAAAEMMMGHDGGALAA